MIHLGSGRDGGRVELPESILTLVIAIMAKRGAGKTYTAGVLEEEFAKANLPFVTVDPVGVHHGIRSSADGSRAAYPIVVFGGEEADIEIGRDSGAEVARAICEEGISAIVDIHQLSKTAWRIFVRDFFQTLFRINRQYGPRMVILEEATEFVPQTRRPEMNESYEAVERTIRLGRNNGLGVTLVSQRAAQVAKDALYGLDILIALRTVGTLDIKALTDMMADQVEADQVEQVNRFKATVNGLPDGEAWLWWPKAHRFEEVVIRERETYHAGATPTFKLVERPVQAVPDLGRLRERFAPAAETPFPDKPYFAGGRAPLDVANELVRRFEERAIAAEEALTLSRQREAEARELVRQWERRAQAEHDEFVQFQDATAHDANLAAAAREFLAQATASELPLIVRSVKVDEDDIRQIMISILGDLDSNQRQIVPLPPAEAIREEFRQRAEVFRSTAVGRYLGTFMGMVKEMPAEARLVFKYLAGEEAYRSRSAIALALWGSNGGDQYRRLGEATSALMRAGLVVKGGSGNSEYKADLAGALTKTLAGAQATPEELAEAENAALVELLGVT